MKALLAALALAVAACDCEPPKAPTGHIVCFSYGQKVYESDTKGYVTTSKDWARFFDPKGNEVTVTGNCTYVEFTGR